MFHVKNYHLEIQFKRTYVVNGYLLDITKVLLDEQNSGIKINGINSRNNL